MGITEEPNNHATVTGAGAAAKSTNFDGYGRVYDDIFYGYYVPFDHEYSAQMDSFLDFESLRLKEIPNQHSPMESNLHRDFRYGMNSSASGILTQSAQRIESNYHHGCSERSNHAIVSPRSISQEGTTTFTDSFLRSTSHAQKRGFCSLRDEKKSYAGDKSFVPPLRISHGLRCNGSICSCGGFSKNSAHLTFLKSSVPLLATDRKGCRFLQEMLREGTCMEMKVIFDEVLLYVVQLMVDPIANYLIQMILEVCNEEQIIQIILAITKEPGQLARIALNTYGSRVVQKLIETVKSKTQIALVKSALEPSFLELIKDQNGNHVIVRCLQCFDYEDYEFILDAAANFSLELSTLQRGCVILQRCIHLSSGLHREILVDQVSNHGLFLAEDQYGNYVVQCIIELQIPSVSSKLVAFFKGKFMQLSMHKFASHVVEKCLIVIEESRAIIFDELLAFPNFERLLIDPFGNYVIHRAIEHAKGGIYYALKAKIQPHSSSLRSNPYCKRIFSLLQKLKR